MFEKVSDWKKRLDFIFCTSDISGTFSVNRPSDFDMSVLKILAIFFLPRIIFSVSIKNKKKRERKRKQKKKEGDKKEKKKKRGKKQRI